MIVHPRFETVRRVFEAALAEGRELGARFTVIHRGEVVADLWGGYADREKTRAFDDETLTPVFSVTKVLAA